MPALILATLLWGLPTAQAPPVIAPGRAASAPPRAPESDQARFHRLRQLVEAAEQALEADDEDTATVRADEADVLTADWSLDLLKQIEVQALLQRLKEVQDQLTAEAAPDAEPGLKATEEVVTISGDELRAELRLVTTADQGITYDFPIDLNDKVLTWVNLFSTTKRGFMENALGRASMYLPMVRQVFAEEGIPSDLAYLAVIESGFRNEANSRAKAVGMWQFIRSTGRIFGLTANKWVEERRDPVKATRAAARYLKRLYELSGDWYLAVSSYNAGPLSLDRAIQNVGTRNFWDLARSRWLRTETKNYVPELCAAILVGRNPARYGINVAPLPPYTYETVTVPSSASLMVLARHAGTEIGVLKALNPELLRPTTPPGSYQLRVPPGKALEFLRRQAHGSTGKDPGVTRYTIRKGDTVGRVAARFQVDPQELLAANDMTAKQFKAGRKILVSPAVAPPRDEPSGAVIRPKAGRLAERPLPPLPILPADLAAPARDGYAPTVPAAVLPGAATSVPQAQAESTPPATPPAPGPDSVQTLPAAVPAATTVTARKGDTLARMARAHGVGLGELMQLNPEAVRRLHPGDAIRLPGSGTAAVTPRPDRQSHTVRKGETLSAIAEAYGATVGDLRAWNRLKGDRIRVGQKLRVSAP